MVSGETVSTHTAIDIRPTFIKLPLGDVLDPDVTSLKSVHQFDDCCVAHCLGLDSKFQFIRIVRFAGHQASYYLTHESLGCSDCDQWICAGVGFDCDGLLCVATICSSGNVALWHIPSKECSASSSDSVQLHPLSLLNLLGPQHPASTSARTISFAQCAFVDGDLMVAYVSPSAHPELPSPSLRLELLDISLKAVVNAADIDLSALTRSACAQSLPHPTASPAAPPPRPRPGCVCDGPCKCTGQLISLEQIPAGDCSSASWSAVVCTTSAVFLVDSSLSVLGQWSAPRSVSVVGAVAYRECDGVRVAVAMAAGGGQGQPDVCLMMILTVIDVIDLDSKESGEGVGSSALHVSSSGDSCGRRVTLRPHCAFLVPSSGPHGVIVSEVPATTPRAHVVSVTAADMLYGVDSCSIESAAAVHQRVIGGKAPPPIVLQPLLQIPVALAAVCSAPRAVTSAHAAHAAALAEADRLKEGAPAEVLGVGGLLIVSTAPGPRRARGARGGKVLSAHFVASVLRTSSGSTHPPDTRPAAAVSVTAPPSLLKARSGAAALPPAAGGRHRGHCGAAASLSSSSHSDSSLSTRRPRPHARRRARQTGTRREKQRLPDSDSGCLGGVSEAALTDTQRSADGRITSSGVRQLVPDAVTVTPEGVAVTDSAAAHAPAAPPAPAPAAPPAHAPAAPPAARVVTTPPPAPAPAPAAPSVPAPAPAPSVPGRSGISPPSATLDSACALSPTCDATPPSPHSTLTPSGTAGITQCMLFGVASGAPTREAFSSDSDDEDGVPSSYYSSSDPALEGASTQADDDVRDDSCPVGHSSAAARWGGGGGGGSGSDSGGSSSRSSGSGGMGVAASKVHEDRSRENVSNLEQSPLNCISPSLEGPSALFEGTDQSLDCEFETECQPPRCAALPAPPSRRPDGHETHSLTSTSQHEPVSKSPPSSAPAGPSLSSVCQFPSLSRPLQSGTSPCDHDTSAAHRFADALVAWCRQPESERGKRPLTAPSTVPHDVIHSPRPVLERLPRSFCDARRAVEDATLSSADGAMRSVWRRCAARLALTATRTAEHLVPPPLWWPCGALRTTLPLEECVHQLPMVPMVASLQRAAVSNCNPTVSPSTVCASNEGLCSEGGGRARSPVNALVAAASIFDLISGRWNVRPLPRPLLASATPSETQSGSRTEDSDAHPAAHTVPQHIAERLHVAAAAVADCVLSITADVVSHDIQRSIASAARCATLAAPSSCEGAVDAERVASSHGACVCSSGSVRAVIPCGRSVCTAAPLPACALAQATQSASFEVLSQASAASAAWRGVLRSVAAPLRSLPSTCVDAVRAQLDAISSVVALCEGGGDEWRSVAACALGALATMRDALQHRSHSQGASSARGRGYYVCVPVSSFGSSVTGSGSAATAPLCGSVLQIHTLTPFFNSAAAAIAAVATAIGSGEADVHGSTSWIVLRVRAPPQPLARSSGALWGSLIDVAHPAAPCDDADEVRCVAMPGFVVRLVSCTARACDGGVGSGTDAVVWSGVCDAVVSCSARCVAACVSGAERDAAEASSTAARCVDALVAAAELSDDESSTRTSTFVIPVPPIMPTASHTAAVAAAEMVAGSRWQPLAALASNNDAWRSDRHARRKWLREAITHRRAMAALPPIVRYKNDFGHVAHAAAAVCGEDVDGSQFSPLLALLNAAGAFQSAIPPCSRSVVVPAADPLDPQRLPAVGECDDRHAKQLPSGDFDGAHSARAVTPAATQSDRSDALSSVAVPTPLELAARGLIARTVATAADHAAVAAADISGCGHCARVIALHEEFIAIVGTLHTTLVLVERALGLSSSEGGQPLMAVDAAAIRPMCGWSSPPHDPTTIAAAVISAAQHLAVGPNAALFTSTSHTAVQALTCCCMRCVLHASATAALPSAWRDQAALSAVRVLHDYPAASVCMSPYQGSLSSNGSPPLALALAAKSTAARDLIKFGESIDSCLQVSG